MESSTQQTLQQLLKIQGNDLCFECAEPTSEWASVNNGIFICEKCAILHKKFGLNVSAVRSIIQDQWSDLHIAMMINGGNLKLRNFFEKYYIPRDGPMDFKYRTKAGYHYRDILRALSEGKIVPDAIDADSALEIEMNADPQTVPDYEVGYDSATPKVQEKEKGLEKISNYVGEKFDQTMQKTKETASIIKEKFQDPGLREDMKQGVISLVQETKNVASKIGDKISDPEFRQNVKEVSDKLADSAKKSVMGALGFLKRITSKELTPSKKDLIDDDKLETVYSVEEPPSKYTRLDDEKGSTENHHPNTL